MGDTKIQWTDTTWNPVRGCSMAKGSETGGCLNCYAARMAARNLPEMKSPTTGRPFARILESGPRWTGEVELIEHKLLDPFAWKRPRRVFVNSMSDLFHESLPLKDILQVYLVMLGAERHTFQVLTKRPERAREFYLWWDREYPGHANPKNVWLGTSVENQLTADTRIPILLGIPDAIRFVSYEPALGPVDFLKYLPHKDCSWCEGKYLDWIIAGGESGPQARPAHPDWFRLVRDQCAGGGVAFFFKQWGEYASVSEVEGGGMHHIFPGGATVRRVGTSKAGRTLDGKEYSQFPEAVAK